jgi:hypothetical protein
LGLKGRSRSSANFILLTGQRVSILMGPAILSRPLLEHVSANSPRVRPNATDPMELMRVGRRRALRKFRSDHETFPSP